MAVSSLTWTSAGKFSHELKIQVSLNQQPDLLGSILAYGRELRLDILCGPFKPKPFYESRQIRSYYLCLAMFLLCSHPLQIYGLLVRNHLVIPISYRKIKTVTDKLYARSLIILSSVFSQVLGNFNESLSREIKSYFLVTDALYFVCLSEIKPLLFFL